MKYDLELRSSGNGWMGTYAEALQRAVEDITDNGPYSPVEVTLNDGTVLTGVLDRWTDGGSFIIQEPDELPRIVDINEVVGVSCLTLQ